MTAIDHAIGHGRREKEERSQYEVSLSMLEDVDGVLQRSYGRPLETELPEAVFLVDDLKIPVYDPDLVNALRSVPPQKRNILLLAYLLGDNDAVFGLPAYH